MTLVRIKLATEVRDVHLDGSLSAGVIRTPQVLDERLARYVAVGRGEQGGDPGLGGCELDPPSCDEGTRRREVDGEIANPGHRLGHPMRPCRRISSENNLAAGTNSRATHGPPVEPQAILSQRAGAHGSLRARDQPTPALCALTSPV